MMKSARSTLIGLVTAVLLCRGGDDVQQRVAGRAFGDTPLLADLHELCDGIGGRPTGWPACERAIAWAAAKFNAAGADSGSTETLTIPKRWVAESAEAECLAPRQSECYQTGSRGIGN